MSREVKYSEKRNIKLKIGVLLFITFLSLDSFILP
jgi:hypothetical protein